MILVTGTGGFMGSHLVDHLLSEEVVATFDYGQKLRKDCKCEYMDLKRAADVYKVIEKYKPEYIFHLGAITTVKESFSDPLNTFAVNVGGTINIYRALIEYNLHPKVIIAGSSAVYGLPNSYPLTEESLTNPLHPYGVSKLAQEKVALQYGKNFNIPTVVLRFFNQTGPRKTNDACSEFIAKVKQGKVVVGNLDAVRDITGYKDTLSALMIGWKSGKDGEVYNVCSEKQYVMRHILAFIQKTLGTNHPVTVDNSLMRPNDEPKIYGSNKKITALGFKITQSIRDIIKEMCL